MNPCTVYPHIVFKLFKFTSVQFPTWTHAADHQKKVHFQATFVCVFNFLLPFWNADIVNRSSTESVAPSDASMDGIVRFALPCTFSRASSCVSDFCFSPVVASDWCLSPRN